MTQLFANVQNSNKPSVDYVVERKATATCTSVYTVRKEVLTLGILYRCSTLNKWVASPYYQNGNNCYNDSDKAFRTSNEAIDYVIDKFQGVA